MERLSRLGFGSGLLIGGLVVVIVWLGTSGAFNLSSSSHLPYHPSDIASIHLQSEISGPYFLSHPKRLDDMPLELVGGFLPDPLPRPLDQPHGCDHTGYLIVKLKNGRELTYGPCSYPWQISELWGAMIEAADLTEPSSPDRARLAEFEHVRQTLRSALARHPIGAKKFAPVEVSCGPSIGGRNEPPPGYLCKVTLRPEPAPGTGVRTRTYCVGLVAGRIRYAEAPTNGICRSFS
jgi:hypothetical protein